MLLILAAGLVFLLGLWLMWRIPEDHEWADLALIVPMASGVLLMNLLGMDLAVSLLVSLLVTVGAMALHIIWRLDEANLRARQQGEQQAQTPQPIPKPPARMQQPVREQPAPAPVQPVPVPPVVYKD